MGMGHQAAVHGETGDVRPTEQLDWAALAAYLRWHLTPGRIKGLDLAQEMAVSQDRKSVV